MTKKQSGTANLDHLHVMDFAVVFGDVLISTVISINIIITSETCIFNKVRSTPYNIRVFNLLKGEGGVGEEIDSLHDASARVFFLYFAIL